jgi:hypothetical protein
LSATSPQREARTGETGLYRAMKWLSDIKCVPLATSGILDSIKQIENSNLDLKMPLYKLKFDGFDKINDVYGKYLDILPEYENASNAARAK